MSVPQEFLQFVKSLPAAKAAGASGLTTVIVTPMTDAHARRWHTTVQPVIDSEPTPRADKGWRWRRLYGVSRMAATALGQKPTAFALGVPDPGDPKQLFPCAMILQAERFSAFDDPSKDCVFVWFMATAPTTFMKKHLPVTPRLLGAAALDIARVRSFVASLDGRVGLHADPAGGMSLTEWYERQGMARVPPGHRISSLRSNDGRYFFYTPAASIAAHHSLSQYR